VADDGSSDSTSSDSTSSDSTSSDSSSSSSSTSSEASKTSLRFPVAAAVEDLEKARGVLPRAPGSCTGQIPLPSTVHWGIGKICLKTMHGESVGYEMVCYKHTVGSTRCTRSRNFEKFGGMEVVERMLKSWLVKGEGPAVTSKQDHVALLDDCLSDLPTLADLDAALQVSRETEPGAAKRQKKGS